MLRRDLRLGLLPVSKLRVELSSSAQPSRFTEIYGDSYGGTKRVTCYFGTRYAPGLRYCIRYQDYSDPSPSANLVGRSQDVLAIMESSSLEHAGARSSSCFDEHAFLNRLSAWNFPSSSAVQF